MSPFITYFNSFDVNYFTPLKKSDLQIYLASHVTYLHQQHHGYAGSLGMYPLQEPQTKLLLLKGVTLPSNYCLAFWGFFLDIEFSFQTTASLGHTNGKTTIIIMIKFSKA